MTIDDLSFMIFAGVLVFIVRRVVVGRNKRSRERQSRGRPVQHAHVGGTPAADETARSGWNDDVGADGGGGGDGGGE